MSLVLKSSHICQYETIFFDNVRQQSERFNSIIAIGVIGILNSYVVNDSVTLFFLNTTHHNIINKIKNSRFPDSGLPHDKNSPLSNFFCSNIKLAKEVEQLNLILIALYINSLLIEKTLPLLICSFFTLLYIWLLSI